MTSKIMGGLSVTFAGLLLAGCAASVADAPAATIATAPEQVEPAMAAPTSAALPADRNVLFWSQEMRAMAFRAMDQMPQLAASRVIAAGANTRALPMGEPLDLGAFDLDAFMDAQSTAAIVVVQDGEIVLERYGLGFSADQKWTSFSVAKSLTSTLVGAAIADGYINSVDDPVTQYITDLAGSAYDDVTIQQLLTMSSGVGWSEDYSDPNSDVAQFNDYVAEDGMDPTVSYLRNLPRASEPGTDWNYSTGETNLVGVLVSEATGKTLSDYLSEKVWSPFGMAQDATWLLGNTGHEIAGCCIQATTRDMARFGLFTLGDGMADGERVVPEGWLEEATSPIFQLDGSGRGYGYQWWTYPGEIYAANGIFGQGIFIDPTRNLVIATNANWAQPTGEGGSSGRLFGFYRAVIGAVEARGSD